ncbi:hypothetical protein, partial [Dokdonella sp.]|uniref:hypothetical protein n=1 Tax=Dokdonella sp. TaxID=2291710 RepID=UPI002F41F531
GGCERARDERGDGKPADHDEPPVACWMARVHARVAVDAMLPDARRMRMNGIRAMRAKRTCRVGAFVWRAGGARGPMTAVAGENDR